MEKLIQHLIQKIYYRYRTNHYRNFIFPLTNNTSQLKKFWEILEKNTKDPLIRFAGFTASYDNYGWHYCQEIVSIGKTKIYEHVITLNQCFFHNLIGYSPNKKNHFAQSCTFTEFLETVAHETAHALQIDLYPNAEIHGKEHQKIKSTLQEWLQEDELVKIFEKDWNSIN